MAGDRLRSFSGVLPSGGVLQSFLAHARGERAFVGWHLLAPLGWVVGAWTRWRNRSFDHGVLLSEEPPLPVVSVGNLTLGGTNKTPFVAMLVETLVQAGLWRKGAYPSSGGSGAGRSDAFRRRTAAAFSPAPSLPRLCGGGSTSGRGTPGAAGMPGGGGG